MNEMLQGMERFKGIFICTTNLLERLDQAALRRFTFKIQFKPLGRIQREQAFVKLACQGDASALTAALQARLAGMDQLEAEHRIKPEVRKARNMGFLV